MKLKVPILAVYYTLQTAHRNVHVESALSSMLYIVIHRNVHVESALSSMLYIVIHRNVHVESALSFGV
jgi:hypothetical protein